MKYICTLYNGISVTHKSNNFVIGIWSALIYKHVEKFNLLYKAIPKPAVIIYTLSELVSTNLPTYSLSHFALCVYQGKPFELSPSLSNNMLK